MSSTLLPVLFANDTDLILTHKNFYSLINEANSGLKKFLRWFQMDKFTLNINKSNFILFIGKKKSYNRSRAKLSVGGKEIISWCLDR